MSSAATNPSNTAAAVEVMERLAETDEITLDRALLSGDARLVVVPQGKRVESLKPLLDQYLVKPDRIVGTAHLTDESSFIAHVNELKEPTTRVFANTDFSGPSFTAVYDYHAVNNGNQLPNWQQHQAIWKIRLSKEWTAWSRAASANMSHQEFAEFLDRHIPDVYWGDQQSEYTKLLVSTLELKLATPSALIGLSRNLAINVETRVKNVQTLSSGEVNIVYDEQHKDGEGQPIKVPNAFLIAIPVVQGGPAYQVLVRLRYRMAGQRITWMLELNRVDIVFDAAMREICERITKETSLPVFLGTPEK